jgi:hypothetical protein
MLDISVKDLRKVITTPKKASDFVKKHITVVEKIDGTKLTLVRNNQDFDPKDYTNNWVVAYKGHIIYPTEFGGLSGREEEIRKESIGTAQYKFVHDHLKKVHPETGSIPKGTEFFVEFVQNKPTITRDYAKKHGMYLVGFGSSEHADVRGQLLTSSNFEDDPEKLVGYAETLQLGTFPVVFDGNLSSRAAVEGGIKDDGLRELLRLSLADVNFSDPVGVVSGAADAFSKLESSLGGSAEGVVIHVGGDEGQLLKVLASDQHDKEVRQVKKQRYKGTPEEEELYWKDVNSLVDDILDEIPNGDPESMMDDVATRVYSMKDLGVSHPAKTLLNKQEDVMLTAKLRLFGTGTHRAKRVAVIPMAAKPFHAGHDSLIKAAIDDGNDSVIVLVSTGGREALDFKDMIPMWRDYYVPGIKARYGNKVVTRFTDAPGRETLLTASDLAKRGQAVVSIYGDEEDAPARAQAVVSKDPSLKDKVVPRVVTRTTTSGVSGTDMRSHLESGDKSAFVAGLPTWLDVSSKNKIWKNLSSKFAVKNENSLRSCVQLIMRS